MHRLPNESIRIFNTWYQQKHFTELLRFVYKKKNSYYLIFWGTIACNKRGIHLAIVLNWPIPWRKVILILSMMLIMLMVGLRDGIYFFIILWIVRILLREIIEKFYVMFIELLVLNMNPLSLNWSCKTYSFVPR